MIRVTESAAQELRALSAKHVSEQGQVLRVDDASRGFSLALGPVSEGDEIVEHEGMPLLHIRGDVALEFADAVLFIDFVETEAGRQFMVYRAEEVSAAEPQHICGPDCSCHEQAPEQ